MTTSVVNLSQEKRMQAKLEKQLTEIRDRPENQKCMDCTEKYPKMFNMTHNTVVCGNCAVIHREMGHRIKALTQSNFDPAEVERLNKGGNQVARDTYLVGWKSTMYREPYPTDTSRVRDFMRMKYIEKRWYQPYTGPIARPKEHDEEEEEEEEVDTRKRSVSEPPAVPTSIPVPALGPNPNDLNRVRSQSYSTQAPPQIYSQMPISPTHSLPAQSGYPISPTQVLPTQGISPISPISPSALPPTGISPISSISPTQSLPAQYNTTPISPTHLAANNQILNPDQWRQVQAQQQQQLQELQLKQQQEHRQYQEAQQKQQDMLKQQHAQQLTQLQQQIQQQQQQLQQQQQQQLLFQQQQQAAQYQQQQQQLQQQQQQLQQQMQIQQQQLQQKQQQLQQLQQLQQQQATQSLPQQPLYQQQQYQAPAQAYQPPAQAYQQPLQQQAYQQQAFQQPLQQQQQQQQQFYQNQAPLQQQPPAQAGAPVSYYTKQLALPQMSQENDYSKALVVHQQVPELSPSYQSTNQGQLALYQPNQIQPANQSQLAICPPNQSQFSSNQGYPVTPDNKALVVHQHSDVTTLKQNPFVPTPAMPVVIAPPPAPVSNDVFNMMECGNVLDFDEDQTLAWQRAEERKKQFLKDEELARKLQEQEGGPIPRTSSQTSRPATNGNARKPTSSQASNAQQEQVFPGINSCGSCQMSVREQDMGRHRVSECVFRPVACPYCKKSVKFIQHKDHVEVCGGKNHVCYVCGLGMTGVHIPSHQLQAHGISLNNNNNNNAAPLIF